jgi:hypothetical protein
LRKFRVSIAIKEAAWRTSLAGRLATFSLGVLAFLAVAALFVPRAAVTLYPESQIQSDVIPVTASDSISSVSLTGSIPAHPLAVVVEQEQKLSVRSQISVPQSKAKGQARFTNLSQSEVLIPAGTVVFSTGEKTSRFVTVLEARVPAGLDQFVEVPIEAVLPGAQGNLDPDLVTAIEGKLGLSLSVTNPEPTGGGTDSRQTGASEADRARLRAEIMEGLQSKAQEQMQARLGAGDLLLLDTFDISQVLEERYSPEAGQPGRDLTLNMQVEYVARYISAEDLNQLTIAALDASMPADFVALAAPAFEAVSDPVTDAEGITHFELEASRTLLHDVDVQKIFFSTRGSNPSSAQERLQDRFTHRKPPVIKLTPSWWPWMPLIPFNISVEVE